MENHKNAQHPQGTKTYWQQMVFKCKRDNITFRSRIVALGYGQIPGIDYTDNFSPVVGEVTLRICLILWVVHDTDIDQVDVETAFFERKLKPSEYQYMRCPEGMLL